MSQSTTKEQAMTGSARHIDLPTLKQQIGVGNLMAQNRPMGTTSMERQNPPGVSRGVGDGEGVGG
jgi:hypothetical protein